MGNPKSLRFTSDDDIPMYSTSLSAHDDGVMISVAVFGWGSGVYWNYKEVKLVYDWLGKWLKKEAQKHGE